MSDLVDLYPGFASKLPRWPLASLASGAGGIPAETEGRSRPGGNGQRMYAGSPSTAGIILPEEWPEATAKALIEFFVV